MTEQPMGTIMRMEHGAMDETRYQRISHQVKWTILPAIALQPHGAGAS
jgi:hypothetical protein